MSKRKIPRGAALLTAARCRPRNPDAVRRQRPTDYRIIDPHVHVWKHDPQFPFAQGANVPARDAAPETLLDLMKANGVSKTVIIQVIHYKYDNRFLASVLKRYPGTFQGVCRVDPLDPAAPDHLSQHHGEGFRGVRISPSANASGRLVQRPADAATLEALPTISRSL